MEEKTQVHFETTKRELLNNTYNLLTAISELADSIDCLDFGKDPADLETDVLTFAASIKTLSKTAQMFIVSVNGEL